MAIRLTVAFSWMPLQPSQVILRLEGARKSLDLDLEI